jgi:hypothetical protein
MITEQQHQIMFASLPRSVMLLRRRTASMTSELMTRGLVVLKRSLALFLDTHQILLTDDVYRAHVANEVWQQYLRPNILYCVLPAKLTWVLQPCDTHVFVTYKHRLQAVCQGFAVDSANGKLSFDVLARGVCQCLVGISEGRSWEKAFEDDTGSIGTQADVSQRIRSKLSFEHTPDVRSDLPTVAQLQNVFPKREVLPIDNMFGMFLPASSAGGAHRMPHVDTTDAPAVPDDMPPGPIHSQPCSFESQLANRVITRAMSGTEGDAAPAAATVAAVVAPGSAASASESGAAAGFSALLADVPGPAGGEQFGEANTYFKLEQDAVRANRKRVTKELKNIQKRKQRLKKRAKQFSDTDLVSVLQLRAADNAGAAAAE